MKVIQVQTNTELLNALESDDVVIEFAPYLNELVFNPVQVIEVKKRKDITINGPITLRGVSLRILKCSNIILENVRVRVGTAGVEKGSNLDGVYAKSCSGVVFNKCTISHSIDELMSFDDCDLVHIDRCIIGPPLHMPRDEDGNLIHKDKEPHGYGIRSSACTSLKITRSLFEGCSKRNPQCNNEGVKNGTTYSLLLKNCIIHNYGTGLVFNSKKNDDSYKYIITIDHNLFVPSYRTKPNTYEIEIEGDEEYTSVRNEDTTKVMHAPLFGFKREDSIKHKKCGSGLEFTPESLLPIMGAQPHDMNDSIVVKQTLDSIRTFHKYDGYDNEYEKWPLSGWPHSL